MEIKRVGTQPSTKGPADWFAGTVRIDPLFQAPDPGRVAGDPSRATRGGKRARPVLGENHRADRDAAGVAPRHTHAVANGPAVSGCGRAQRWGGPIEEIHPGDVVWFSPGEKHWHGATPTTAMTHIAIQEKKDGKVVDWMEHVSDDQYQAGK